MKYLKKNFPFFLDEFSKLRRLSEKFGGNKTNSELFIDRDPISEESKSDYLNPTDLLKFNNYSQLSSPVKKEKPFDNVRCIYNEEYHTYNDRLI